MMGSGKRLEKIFMTNNVRYTIWDINKNLKINY